MKPNRTMQPLNVTPIRFASVLMVSSLALTVAATHADEPEFQSDFFKSRTLVYSDNFNETINRERWGAPSQDKQLKDGHLVVTAKFKSKEEAMEVLKRDHHLGLEPIIHLNQIPESFTCKIRFKFESEKLTTGRPVLQIGHHMILFNYLEGGGHRIKLPDGPTFAEPDSGVKLGDWINMAIQYKKGKIAISLNNHHRLYEHDAVTMVNEKDKFGPRFTFKGGPNCRIIFDSVDLWKGEE